MDSRVRPVYTHQKTASDPVTITSSRGVASPEPLESPRDSLDGKKGSRFGTTGLPGEPQRSATSNSVLIEDPSLVHLDIARKFGEVGDYWIHYDKLSDTYTSELVKGLQDNLDVYLIFSGLFSAVNASVLILTLGMLSPPPDASTVQLLGLLVQGQVIDPANLAPPLFKPTAQGVRVNCFLAASLTSSMGAAFAACLGKKWVMDFAESQVGSLESQGRARQRKLNAAKKYKFQDLIEAMGVLLQTSLLLFLIGCIDYSLSINFFVALTVIVLGACGCAAYFLTTALALYDPQCPFQTPVSTFVRKATSWFLRKKRRFHYHRLRTRKDSTDRLATKRGWLALAALAVQPIIATLEPDASDIGADEKEAEVGIEEDAAPVESRNEEASIDAQTACWIVETSEHEAALFTTARNIPALTKIQGTQLNADGSAFERLLALFQQALATARSPNNSVDPSHLGCSPLEGAVVYGRALCHALLGSATDQSRLALKSHTLLWPNPRKTGSSPELKELFFIKVCMEAVVPQKSLAVYQKDGLPRLSSSAPIYLAALLRPSINKGEFYAASLSLDRLKLVQWLISAALEKPERCYPTAVGLSAYALGLLPHLMVRDHGRFDGGLHQKWWDAYTSERDLYPNIIKALNVYHYYTLIPTAIETTHASLAEPEPRHFALREYAELYSTLVAAARTIIQVASKHHGRLNELTLELDASFRQTLRVVESQISVADQSDNGLVEALKILGGEIKVTLKALRNSNVEAMLPRSNDAAENTSGAPDEPTLAEDRLLSTTSPPDLTATFVTALNTRSDGTRYAALAILQEHGATWFTDSEAGPNSLQEAFKSAGLAQGLRLCVDDGDHFELVAGILNILLKSGYWTKLLVDHDVLAQFYSKGREILRTKPTFERLELYLDVYVSCISHEHLHPSIVDWEDTDTAIVLANAIEGISLEPASRGHLPLPYTPEAFVTYADAVLQNEASTPALGDHVKGALKNLEESSSATWWDFADISMKRAPRTV